MANIRRITDINLMSGMSVMYLIASFLPFFSFSFFLFSFSPFFLFLLFFSFFLFSLFSFLIFPSLSISDFYPFFLLSFLSLYLNELKDTDNDISMMFNAICLSKYISIYLNRISYCFCNSSVANTIHV